MREPPGGKSVGRKARMNERDRRDVIGLGEIGVIRVDLLRKQEPFVDDRRSRKARDVKVFGARPLLADDLVLHAPAKQEELAREFGFRKLPALDENLLAHGLSRPGMRADLV